MIGDENVLVKSMPLTAARNCSRPTFMTTAQLRAIDDMSTDPYASLRSLFEQNRAGQIQDAVTGRTGSAEPVFQDFDDPGAAPVSAPPPPEVKPSAVIDSIVNARLNKPLRLMAPDMVTGELVPVFVESPQAG